ncbi:MAG: response regulator [Sedimentisphaerales bacterium]|nr:response regulator [Sedimentisphaerales bacterium]
MQKSKPILLVEDDNIDFITVKRALNDLKVTNDLIRVINGEEALDYLRNETNRRPCIILLDLNMPKMNGIEFLKEAKADDELRMIPVIVLTTSQEQRDIVESFKLSVAGYMLKAGDYSEFTEIIRMIDLYWTLSETPRQIEQTAESRKTSLQYTKTGP